MTVRVFLVEDLAGMRALLLDLFKSIGRFQVMGTATTEAEAYLWLEQFPDLWDIAVVDLILAEGSGMNVIRRAKNARPDGRVVVLSGYASPGIREHCLALGAEAVFDKAETEKFIAWLDQVHQADREPPAA